MSSPVMIVEKAGGKPLLDLLREKSQGLSTFEMPDGKLEQYQIAP